MESGRTQPHPETAPSLALPQGCQAAVRALAAQRSDLSMKLQAWTAMQGLLIFKLASGADRATASQRCPHPNSVTWQQTRLSFSSADLKPGRASWLIWGLKVIQGAQSPSRRQKSQCLSDVAQEEQDGDRTGYRWL